MVQAVQTVQSLRSVQTVRTTARLIFATKWHIAFVTNGKHLVSQKVKPIKRCQLAADAAVQGSKVQRSANPAYSQKISRQEFFQRN
jgi:hypothetical protein